MAQVISRVLDAPKGPVCIFDERECKRGTNDSCAAYMRYLTEKAKRYGYPMKSGVLSNGRVYLKVTFSSGRVERFEMIMD